MYCSVTPPYIAYNLWTFSLIEYSTCQVAERSIIVCVLYYFRSEQLLMDDQDDVTIGISENPPSAEQEGYSNPGFAAKKEEEVR